MTLRTVSFMVLMCALTAVGLAQEPAGRNEARFIAGVTGWLDEVTDISASWGGSYRRYLTPKLSIEPEFLYMIGEGSIRDFTFIPHVAYDFSSGAVRPYVIGGVGWLHHRQEFPGAQQPQFSHNEATVSGGVGVKVYVTRRFFVAPEVRIGFEPIFRVAGTFGFVF